MRYLITTAAMLVLAPVAVPAHGRKAAQAPLRVTATTSTIASLVRAVGGDDVVVTVLDHEHGTMPAAQQASVIAQAQLVVLNGDRLEAEWLSALLETASNAALRPGGRGNLDVSRLGSPADCAPLELLDPMRGLALASAIRDRLEALRPARQMAFTEAYETFRARLSVAMMGDRIGTKYPIEKVADLHRLGTLERFLAAQHETTLLGGWFGRLLGRQGVKAVADSRSWSCFASRLGIEIAATLAPSGAPSAKAWKKDGVAMALAGMGPGGSSLRAAAKRAHVPLAELVGQVAMAPGTDDYLGLIDVDVQAVERALGRAPRPAPAATP